MRIEGAGSKAGNKDNNRLAALGRRPEPGRSKAGQDRCVLLGLVIAFNRANPIYGRYISLGQLFIRATPEGLELFHTGEKTEIMISRVSIGVDGRLGQIDFLKKDKVRALAEDIFPGLGRRREQ